MDIKWKNSMLLIVWVVLFTIGVSGTISAFSHGSEYIKKDFFQSSEFESELNRFIGLLSIYELHDKTKEELKEGITVSKEEIDEHRNQYGNLSEQVSDIENQYELQIEEALAADNKEIADLYKTERDKKIEDITNNFKNDEYVRKKVINEEEQTIDKLIKEKENYNPEFQNDKTAFKYYLKNTGTGKVFSNLNGVKEESVNEIINNKNMLSIQSYSEDKNGYLSTEDSLSYVEFEGVAALSDSEENQKFEGQIAIPKSLSADNDLMTQYHDFRERQIFYYVYSGIGILALFLSLYIYKKTRPFNFISSLKWAGYYQWIPLDVRLIAFMICFPAMLAAISFSSDIYMYGDAFYSLGKLTFALPLAIVFVTVTLLQGSLLISGFKEIGNLKEELKNGLIYRGYLVFMQSFLYKSMGVQMLALLIVIFASGFGVGFLLYNPQEVGTYVILFILVTVPFLAVLIIRMGYFNSIVKNSSELAKGNPGPDLPVKGHSVLAKLAGSINTLKHGVNASQKAQAKSERLKTELITNVSHDLRTPLTSIISYTELLKTPDLAGKDREAYIQIIDRKSKRLKVLIDDLFEASKMASGNIELVKAKVDIVQLLQQALAEHDETIKASTLQLRVSTPEKPVYTFVDGQKVWRVFDNLIGNILKYSLEHTRVYITLGAENRHVVITFKNISKYDLGGNIDELIERFKRGDTSRHTDGSGLGLAIAKSIVDLHEGNLDIEVDGDLFKVTVELETI
ncbi:GHKL domain-containing protein [Peribacillus cavernae]|uniref:histidine kinase n=1 Tax=Peribacillus cavernae TaxID=1674310 RepID=A0A3S0VH67_9BACI|nr:HAMP domain-containing sensor histidine kinase [Peribacillus cavernae]MDQ0220995.1 signal transduction histidine kinase [Peribacillus cavernae]RUQ27911.1 GHKL domain-containing protein [Peribacillus cavernae]